MKHLGKLLPRLVSIQTSPLQCNIPRTFCRQNPLIHLGEKRQDSVLARVELRHTDLKFDVFLQLGHHTPKLDQYLSLIQNNGLNHICSLL